MPEGTSPQGLSAASFTIGVLNMLGVTWLYGAYPEHFWLVYAGRGGLAAVGHTQSTAQAKLHRKTWSRFR